MPRNSASDYENYIVRFELDIRDLEAGATRAANKLGLINAQLGNNNRDLQTAQRALARFGGAQDDSNQKQDRFRQSLSTTRYALYDVSNTLGIAGVALLGLATATFGVSVAFERDFANVVRTSRVTGDAIDTLRQNFVSLGQDIPVAYSQLSRIASLGGQLGIDASDLTAFTSIVARFSATTNLSVDEAATAFGRLKALLPDVADGSISLEALASSILKVGTNSVATESEIARIAVQISSMAGYAGITADELVGLAGALASVGTQPELARGTITRLFTLIGRAVTENGPKLQEFARLAGVSAEEFANSWGTDKFGPIFKNFINGLGQVQSSGGDVVATLNELGISSVRDVPALTRLATAANSAGEAGQLLNQTFSDAAEGIQNATELSDQYGIIAATVASKIQVLVNNFTALLSAIGGGGTIFGGALDLLNGLLEALTEIAQNPVGNFFIQLVTVLTALGGVLTLTAAVVLRGVAGWYALQAAVIGVGAAGTSTRFSLAALQAQLLTLGVSARTAGAAMGVLRFGIVGVVAALAAGVSFAFMQNLTSLSLMASETILGLKDDTESLMSQLNKSGAFTEGGFMSFVRGLNKDLANVGLTSDVIANDLKSLDDRFAELARGGNIAEVRNLLEELAKANNVSVEQILSKLPEVRKQLDLQAESAGNGATAMTVLAEASEITADYQEALASSLGLTVEGLDALEKGLAANFSSLVGLSETLGQVRDATRLWAEAQAAATEDSSDSWQDFYDGVSYNLVDYNNQLEANLAATANWQANLMTLMANGANADAIAQLIALGPQEGAALTQKAIDDIEGEGRRLIGILNQTGGEAPGAFASEFTANASLISAAFTQGGTRAATDMKNALISGSSRDVNAIVSKYNLDLSQNPLQIQATTGPAYNSVNGFLNWVRNQSGSITINGYVKASGVGPGHATGGPIYGPGTSTSDSIPARLSRGEYVIRAASVRKYGMGIFDSLNRGVARFASGGPVASSGVATNMGGAGMTYLDPETTSLLRQLVKYADRPVTVIVGDETISRAAQRGDSVRQSRGESRA